jgi:hypothetical protein
LLADPELGGRVERDDPLALGYLDSRHGGITAELKVERRVPATKASARSTSANPRNTQPPMAILGLSSKALPVGTPENDMFTFEPRPTA